MLVHLYQPIHERSDMVWSEHLPAFRFLFITVELIEKYSHHILSVPVVGINAIGNLRNPSDKVVYGLLVVGHIHLYLRIDFYKKV